MILVQTVCRRFSVMLHLREPLINRTRKDYFSCSFYLTLLTLPCTLLQGCLYLALTTHVSLLPFFSCVRAAGCGQEEATELCCC